MDGFMKQPVSNACRFIWHSLLFHETIHFREHFVEPCTVEEHNPEQSNFRGQLNGFRKMSIKN